MIRWDDLDPTVFQKRVSFKQLLLTAPAWRGWIVLLSSPPFSPGRRHTDHRSGWATEQSVGAWEGGPCLPGGKGQGSHSFSLNHQRHLHLPYCLAPPKCLRNVHRNQEEPIQEPSWFKGLSYTRPSAHMETEAHRQQGMLVMKTEKQKGAQHCSSLPSLDLQPVSVPWTGWTTVYLQPTWETRGEPGSERGHSHEMGWDSLFPECKIL